MVPLACGLGGLELMSRERAAARLPPRERESWTPMMKEGRWDELLNEAV
jgi:hypothetical protein